MSVTLENLYDGARDMADIVGNPHVEDPTLTRWANRGIERAYQIASACCPSAFQTSQNFTLIGGSGQNTVAVPATMRQLVHVAKDPTNPSLRRVLRKYNADEAETVQMLSYRRIGATVAIEPYLVCAGNFALYFLAGPTVLAILGDAMLSVLEPCAEYVETYMAIKAIDKEESDSRQLRLDLAELKSDLEVYYSQLDAGSAETIVDVDNVGNRWPWDLVP